MKKYTIRQDEVWPEYQPFEPAVVDYAIDIPEQFMDRYRKASAEWDAVQRVLEKLYDEQEKEWMARRRNPSRVMRAMEDEAE